MLSFVALPSFLILVTLARLGVYVDAVEPVNSPDSARRFRHAPEGVDTDIVLEGAEYHMRYPRNTAELTVAAALRADTASNPERIRAIRDLAWWTAVCPGYAPFTLPRLAHALRDPDPGVKGAAAIGLGSIGHHAGVALPDLVAARGTSVRYFDHLVAEAVVLIENTPRWPSATECEDASVTQLESRSRAQTVAADRVR
jgi:hypothetical protein